MYPILPLPVPFADKRRPLCVPVVFPFSQTANPNGKTANGVNGLNGINGKRLTAASTCSLFPKCSHPLALSFARSFLALLRTRRLQINEHYFAGDYTISGGLFASLTKAPCHVMYKMFALKGGKFGKGKDLKYSRNPAWCLPPCALKNGADDCYVKDTSGDCICVDPCQLMSNKRNFHMDDYNFGHDSTEADCEWCTKYKADHWGADIGFRGGPRDGGRKDAPPWFKGDKAKGGGGFEPVRPLPRWAMKKSPYSCGFCGTQCISGSKRGPFSAAYGDDNYMTYGGNDCADHWQWKLHDCRLHKLTAEDERGSEVEVAMDLVYEVTGSESEEITDPGANEDVKNN